MKCERTQLGIVDSVG